MAMGGHVQIYKRCPLFSINHINTDSSNMPAQITSNPINQKSEGVTQPVDGAGKCLSHGCGRWAISGSAYCENREIILCIVRKFNVAHHRI